MEHLGRRYPATTYDGEVYPEARSIGCERLAHLITGGLDDYFPQVRPSHPPLTAPLEPDWLAASTPPRYEGVSGIGLGVGVGVGVGAGAHTSGGVLAIVAAI